MAVSWGIDRGWGGCPVLGWREQFPDREGYLYFGFRRLRHTAPLDVDPRASPWPNPRRTADETNRILVAILSFRRFRISVTGSAYV